MSIAIVSAGLTKISDVGVLAPPVGGQGVKGRGGGSDPPLIRLSPPLSWVESTPLMSHSHLILILV